MSENNENDEQPKGNDDFIWIDGEDTGKRVPLFHVEQTVVTVNPFTHEYAIMDLDETPLYYVIKSIRYDLSGQTYRYFLEGEDQWFAEEWLAIANIPSMTTELRVDTELYLIDTAGEGKVDESDLSNEEVAVIDRELDEMTQQFTIDRCLETISNGTPEEVRVAKKVLEGVAE